MKNGQEIDKNGQKYDKNPKIELVHIEFGARHGSRE
jgi:hypothetical protein